MTRGAQKAPGRVLDRFLDSCGKTEKKSRARNMLIPDVGANTGKVYEDLQIIQLDL